MEEQKVQLVASVLRKAISNLQPEQYRGIEQKTKSPLTFRQFICTFSVFSVFVLFWKFDEIFSVFMARKQQQKLNDFHLFWWFIFSDVNFEYFICEILQ